MFFLKNFLLQALAERKLEMTAWQDLASIYTKLGSWPDAEICMDKAKSIEFYSPRSWHTTGSSSLLMLYFVH
jgi:hypothetical protein